MNASHLSLLTTALLLLSGVVAVQSSDLIAPALTGSEKLSWQYECFRANVERDGPVEVLVVGNSFARQGIHIGELREAVKERTGRAPSAFNLGAGGTAAGMLPFVLDLAYGLTRPSMCLIVLDARAIAAQHTLNVERTELARSSPYGRALGDELRWRGSLHRWLLDHFALYSRRHGLRSWLLLEGYPEREVGEYTYAWGYFGPGPKDEFEWELLEERLGDWSLTDETLEAVATAVRRAQAAGTHVWLVEAPVHPEAVAYFPGGEAGLEEVRAAIRRVAEETGATVLLVGPELELAAEDFRDTTHLDEGGARRFTRWVVDAVGAGWDGL